MTLLEDELKELRLYAERQIESSTLEACVKAMVRVNIQRTKYKQLVACFQFLEDYPNQPALIELRSRHISQKLVDGLTKLCEEEVKKYVGKPQVLRALKFISNFLDDNPLCCCSEEISAVRRLLNKDSDELKLRQKSSSVSLRVQEGEYFLKYNISIPDNYPDTQIQIEEKECNFPPVFRRWFHAQSVETARKCVHPPAKRKPKDPPFVKQPSLEPVISFLIEEVHKYPKLKCPVCKKLCFPPSCKDTEMEDNKPLHVERIYCGHTYHNKCLDTYIRTPPFQGGKTCHVCKSRIYHDKWKITPELAEARWAHKQAKQRELDEVVDFLS